LENFYAFVVANMPFFKPLFRRIRGLCGSQKADDDQNEKGKGSKRNAVDPDASTEATDKNAAQEPNELSLASELFDSQITLESLSHFIIWYLYYDIVEMPRSPTQWYDEFPLIQLEGWIQLGHDLGQENAALATGLAHACHKMALNYTNVQDKLIRFSSWVRMAQTETAEAGGTSIESMNKIREILESDRRLLEGLRPGKDDQRRGRQATIIARTVAILGLIVLPTLAKECHRAETIYRTKSVDNFVRRRNIGIMWRALQKRRQVPMKPYRILDQSPTPSAQNQGQRSRSVTPLDEAAHELQCLASRNALLESDAIRMRQEIDQLKRESRHDSAATYTPSGTPVAVTAARSIEDLSTPNPASRESKPPVPPLPRLRVSSVSSFGTLSRPLTSSSSFVTSSRPVTPVRSGVPVSFSMPFRNVQTVTIRAPTSTESPTSLTPLTSPILPCLSPTNEIVELPGNWKELNASATSKRRKASSLKGVGMRLQTPVLPDDDFGLAEIIDQYFNSEDRA